MLLRRSKTIRRLGNRVVCLLALMVVWATVAMPVRAQSAWKCIYYRQIGHYENGGRSTIENHLFYENGTKAAGVGVTNLSNSTFAIFGDTDAYGHNRINPLDPNNCAYDIRVYDPSSSSENTPSFYHQDPNQSPTKFYSYVTHWMEFSNPGAVTTYPQTPVYHYDLVDGLNQVSGLNMETCQAATFTEPDGFYVDQKTLAYTNWKSWQAQTFVVPAGINRIVSAQAFVTRTAGEHLSYIATIRHGGPTGQQIGPAAYSRDLVSAEFKEVAVCWGLDDVPVVPGQTYALRLESQDGLGFNVYATELNNYTQGILYNGSTQVPDHDMLAVVVGVDYSADPPVLDIGPTVFEHIIPKNGDVSPDTFDVANMGGGQMNYSMTDDADWLSTLPAGGDLWSGQSDTVTVSYDTFGLSDGTHLGTIEVYAPGAIVDRQYVTVTLTIRKPADFDGDGDVDQVDFGFFQACYSGDGATQTDPACAAGRLDTDSDVDMEDFGLFQRCFSGANTPSSGDCLDG